MQDYYTKAIEALQLAGMSESTRLCYARSVRQLADHCGKTPDLITEEQLRDCFLHRINESDWAPAIFKICYCGIKFFFKNVLKREWHIFKILRAQQERRLPCVLSKSEIDAILKQIRTLHNCVFPATVYSCGLRLQKTLCLQVSDIDGKRMKIHVHRGKGAKDRYVPLPEGTLFPDYNGFRATFEKQVGWRQGRIPTDLYRIGFS